MKQHVVINKDKSNAKRRLDLGFGLVIEIDDSRQKADLYRHGMYVKKVDLSDRVAKRLFVVETVDLGAVQLRLAKALGISRQSIHTYLETRKHFGLEGLIQGYTPSASKSLSKQRRLHRHKRIGGIKARQVEEIRRREREKRQKRQLSLDLLFNREDDPPTVEDKEQPFCQEHDWKATRYAGAFSFLICLIDGWKWLELVMGYFGRGYKIFMVFLLMAARNIRSIEQLKNVRCAEAGLLLGIGRLPTRSKVWEWFYGVAHRQISPQLLKDYFRYQIKTGLVSIWLWFVDGHLLPYTGNRLLHYSYSTQRRMPVPGRTNIVTCDGSGRVVDFDIQEGKGNLRGHIAALAKKWAEELPKLPVMVFDREGHGAGFFWGLIQDKVPFVTWEKYADAKKLAAVEANKFKEEFELNFKKYAVFEDEKSFTYVPEEGKEEKRRFTLRRIYLWNKSSNRRACGLVWDENKQMSTKDCARAILSRWGASENTFKHMKERHPLHYHPGFKMVESDKQEVANPAVKEKEGLIKRLQKELNKLYKKLVHHKERLNKSGNPRKNSTKERLQHLIREREAELNALKEEKSRLPERVNMSSLQDYRSFKRIDNEGKYLFDFVTCSLWNARKQMVDWLRGMFNQENEVVDLFYAITHCQGWIKSTREEVTVRLEPLQQPKRQLAQEQLCRKLTNLSAKTPMGKLLVIEVGESPL